MKNQKVSMLFVVLAVLFTSCIVLANIAAAKQLQFFSWNMPAGVLVFPISYIVSDVMVEVYGFKTFKNVIFLGFAMNLLAVLIFTVANVWSAPIWFEGAEAFDFVVSSTPRLLVAGLSAYLLGSWVNGIIMSKMKLSAYKNGTTEGFKLRAVVSTLAGEFVDSMIFIPIAFLGVLPLEQIPSMIIVQVLFKTLYEIIILPVTSLVVAKVKNYEGMEVVGDDKQIKLP